MKPDIIIDTLCHVWCQVVGLAKKPEEMFAMKKTGYICLHIQPDMVFEQDNYTMS